MKTLIAASLFMAGVVTIGSRAPAVAAEPCNPAGKLDFVCGPLNSEDLVQVPGTAMDRSQRHGWRRSRLAWQPASGQFPRQVVEDPFSRQQPATKVG